MNKKKNNNAKKKAKQAPRRRSTILAVPSVLRDPRVRAWDSLLRDPCGASMAHPCYAGADSGYLVRTSNLYSPTVIGAGLVVGGISYVDAAFQYTPWNLSLTTGLQVGGALTNGAFNMAGAGFQNFITGSGSVVARYRAVASCLKWVPYGPYGFRSGLVGSAYSPGMALLAGDPGQAAVTLPLMQRVVPNGDELHEIRWLPSSIDEEFTSTGAGLGKGAGSVIMILKGVDGTNTSATSTQVNGSFEVTTVWEWIPAVNQGATISPSSPLPYTTQQVLSTIEDFGAYVFHGVRQGADMARNVGVIAAGAMVAEQFVRRAANVRRNNAPAFIR